MQDTASHGAPQHDNDGLRHTLSVHDVEAQLLAAGVPRSHRHIIRLCKAGLFDAKKLPGGSGDEWFIAPSSVPKAIGDLRAMQENRDRRSTPQHATSDHVVVEKVNNSNSDTASRGAPQPAVSDKETSQKGSETEPVMARYVQQLEKRIEEKDDVIGLLKGQLVAKDEQIGELSTRYRETHSLLGAMQRMFAPLLGQSDPYVAPETREVDTRGN